MRVGGSEYLGRFRPGATGSRVLATLFFLFLKGSFDARPTEPLPEQGGKARARQKSVPPDGASEWDGRLHVNFDLYFELVCRLSTPNSTGYHRSKPNIHFVTNIFFLAFLHFLPWFH